MGAQVDRNKWRGAPDAFVACPKIMFNFQKVKNKFNFITYLSMGERTKIILKFLRGCNQIFAFVIADFLQLIFGEVFSPGFILKIKYEGMAGALKISF
jgi:hypothetical protein